MRIEAYLKAVKMATMMQPPGKVDDGWEENLNLHMQCPDCQVTPANLVEEFSSGDMVCGDCGLVLGGRIVDTRSEWRTFSNDDQATDDPSRVGVGRNELLNGDQLNTEIAHDGSKSRELLRAQGKSTADKGNKALLAAYKQIGAMSESIHLPRLVSDTAKHLYKMVHDDGVLRGKTQEALIAGCLIIAGRHCNSARTFREIHAVTRVPKKEIGRVFKALEKYFTQKNLEKLNSDMTPPDTRSTNAVDLCVRFCSALGLNHDCVKVSQGLAEKMGDIGGLAGRSPLSAAAACIYFASNLMRQPKTAKEISAVAGVSDGTIRTSYKLLEAEKEKLVDPSWIANGKGDLSLLPKA